MEPKQPARPEPRRWQALDEHPRPSRPTDPEERGLREFLRKLTNLFSLDPRSGGR